MSKMLDIEKLCENIVAIPIEMPYNYYDCRLTKQHCVGYYKEKDGCAKLNPELIARCPGSQHKSRLK